MCVHMSQFLDFIGRCLQHSGHQRPDYRNTVSLFGAHGTYAILAPLGNLGPISRNAPRITHPIFQTRSWLTHQPHKPLPSPSKPLSSKPLLVSFFKPLRTHSTSCFSLQVDIFFAAPRCGWRRRSLAAEPPRFSRCPPRWLPPRSCIRMCRGCASGTHIFRQRCCCCPARFEF